MAADLSRASEERQALRKTKLNTRDIEATSRVGCLYKRLLRFYSRSSPFRVDKMITEALVNEYPGAPFVYRKVELEDGIGDNEALVQIKATGVCHTDLNFSKEKSRPDLFPAILGHEGKVSHGSL